MSARTVARSHPPSSVADPAVVAAARAGLASAPRWLPPWLFYDQRGSALFEAITRLPSYYLTRAERAIFVEHGAALLTAAGLTGDATVVELGAGTATKTELLLATLLGRGRTRYVPIDVSPAALEEAQARLRAHLPGLVVEPWAIATHDALPRLASLPGPLAVLFIGSSIGNHDQAEATALVAAVRAAVPAGTALVLGTDLRKSPAVLLPAYDDPEGVTAAFNRNVLVRLARELGASFDPERFRHVALWNPAASRIEMHLESVGAQQVDLGQVGLVIDLADGERIHTESSVKYDLPMVEHILGAAGFSRTHTFLDCDERFAVHVARAVQRRTGDDVQAGVASSLGFPALGFGLGLRPPHHHEALTAAPPVDWWEVISENFMVAGGTPRRVLRALRASRSVVLHGVSLSIGSAEPLDRGYLERLAALVDEIEPGLVSDHLCWSSLGGHASHDLWPLPYTEEALALVVDKVRRVQDRLGRRILLENPSSYVSKPWVSVRFMIDPWQRGAAGRDRARRAGTTRARR